MPGMGDLLTEVQQDVPVVHVVFDNGMLDVVDIERRRRD